MNIYLIGYRGTGKSTIAPILAAKWNLRCVDVDDAVEQYVGRSIAEIFTDHGEEFFRNFETFALEKVEESGNCVVATGGGIVTREVNRSILSKGYCVWLSASAEAIHMRVKDSDRPQLSVGGLEEIRNLLSEREVYYRELANLVVDTSRYSVDQVVEMIEGSI
jgi:shikimate kinase